MPSPAGLLGNINAGGAQHASAQGPTSLSFDSLNNLHLRQIVLRPDFACVSPDPGRSAAFSFPERGSTQQEAPGPLATSRPMRAGAWFLGYSRLPGSCESCVSGGMTDRRNVMLGRRIARSVTRASNTASVRVRLRPLASGTTGVCREFSRGRMLILALARASTE
jgi:hypothetical protein